MRINFRNLLLLLFDMCCFMVASVMYFVLTNFVLASVAINDVTAYWINVGVIFGTIFLSRCLMGVYTTIWRYTSSKAYFMLMLSDIIGCVLALVILALLKIEIFFWFLVMVAVLTSFLSLFGRFSYRLIYKHHNVRKNNKRAIRTNIAIVGAGQLGAFLANELQENPNSMYKPVCFFDDNSGKVNNTVCGLKVYSGKQFTYCRDRFEISSVVIAISHADSEKLAYLREYYEKFGCKVLIYDHPLFEDGKQSMNRVIREFQIEDLLFRKPLNVAETDTGNYYENKVILVTGGGGSIGSELCRQLSLCKPKKLIIFDIYENNAYDIEQELLSNGTDFDLVVEIGSVRDSERLDYIFDKYRPDVVFHAAAHKHVPLMEHSSCEAIKNNVFGTYKVANMAELYGVKKFILISTDKAVNPTNIMGASKRLCEMIVQCRTDSKTSFAAVRFGNVLGSNGSVIPLFKKQIKNGGPVTITDKRIIRYFMTIPEASQLVMTAGAMANNGELFVLDMGKPVKIYDLACGIIKLSGLIPHVDIEIKEIGLRPGEKLYEELLMKTEKLLSTKNKMIFIEKDKPFTRSEVDEKLGELSKAVKSFEEDKVDDAIKIAIKNCVPTFHEPEELNKTAENSKEMKLSKLREEVKATKQSKNENIA